MYQEQIDRLKVAAVLRPKLLLVARRLSFAIYGARLQLASPIDGYTETAWISL